MDNDASYEGVVLSVWSTIHFDIEQGVVMHGSHRLMFHLWFVVFGIIHDAWPNGDSIGFIWLWHHIKYKYVKLKLEICVETQNLFKKIPPFKIFRIYLCHQISHDKDPRRIQEGSKI